MRERRASNISRRQICPGVLWSVWAWRRWGFKVNPCNTNASEAPARRTCAAFCAPGSAMFAVKGRVKTVWDRGGAGCITRHRQCLRSCGEGLWLSGAGLEVMLLG